jgi:hypothetical protein
MSVTAIRCVVGFVAVAIVGRGLAAQASQPKVDPGWLRADSAAHSATLTLVAGLTSANGGMNFDGFGSGHLTVNVPTHWTVVLQFKNADQNLPHSAEVVPVTPTVPQGEVKPAFLHAETSSAGSGTPPEGKQDIRFVAGIPGQYWIFCAVAGHGAAGMWIHLNVADDLGAPNIEPTPDH